ncbi:MAG: hypothetical protein JST26_09900 [Bacteroidetes bacterium]|nr:hypothetical protein [Bacteroidota bacterium]
MLQKPGASRAIFLFLLLMSNTGFAQIGETDVRSAKGLENVRLLTKVYTSHPIKIIRDTTDELVFYKCYKFNNLTGPHRLKRHRFLGIIRGADTIYNPWFKYLEFHKPTESLPYRKPMYMRHGLVYIESSANKLSEIVFKRSVLGLQQQEIDLLYRKYRKAGIVKQITAPISGLAALGTFNIGVVVLSENAFGGASMRDNSLLYAGTAIVAASATTFIMASIKRKVYKKRLIKRYNELIQQKP